MKKALITGVTGQDGSYLTELLLKKGYKVYGLHRRTSYPNTFHIDHLYGNPKYPNFVTFYGDLSDGANLCRTITKIEPDEIYNLGAQSHVGVSFTIPEYTANVNGLGTLRILDAVRDLKVPVRYYQAGSSEMFGNSDTFSQNEMTPFNPQSPYAASKVFAYHITRTYRMSYGIFAANGILFNHESPRRGTTFVTRKITLGLSRIKAGLQKELKLGNLDAKRDWGFAKDYVKGIWAILQHTEAADFVLATGENHTVREVVEAAGQCIGFTIVWQGKGSKETGIDKKTGKTIVYVDEACIRPTEVYQLKGDTTKAQQILGWKPKTTFSELIEIMMKADYNSACMEAKFGRTSK